MLILFLLAFPAQCEEMSHYHCLTACRQSAAVPIRRPLQELRLLHAAVPGHRGQEETRGLTDLSHPPVVHALAAAATPTQRESCSFAGSKSRGSDRLSFFGFSLLPYSFISRVQK